MPVASLPEVMDRAFQKRYGVAAFNTVDDITMHGVIRAAEQSRSPLIVQISVKTVYSKKHKIRCRLEHALGRTPMVAA